MSDDRNDSYFAYWGKAQPRNAETERYHLLPYHCLDVATCGWELLQVPRFSVAKLSSELGWGQAVLEDLCVAFLAIHDIGKFASSFQGLADDLGPALVPGDHRRLCRHRHDTLGWVACRELAKLLPDHAPNAPTIRFLFMFARIFTGHHGKPPFETEGDSDPQIILPKKCFGPEDLAAAEAYAREVLTLFIRRPLPPVKNEHVKILERRSWTLAGFAVLADWLGSDSDLFRYRERPMELSSYWSEIALPAAQKSIALAGLHRQEARSWTGASDLLPKLNQLTPLQQYAANIPFTEGPQFSYWRTSPARARRKQRCCCVTA